MNTWMRIRVELVRDPDYPESRRVTTTNSCRRSRVKRRVDRRTYRKLCTIQLIRGAALLFVSAYYANVFIELL
ncbi:MAG: hypothetical protein J0H14_21260 [Alphaproteobacteria bacterium]|nr:hypothetical protein [Alphaproteobacteria bacterium]